jgi:hypothetical protein
MKHSGLHHPLARGCALAFLLASGSARADSSGMDWIATAYVWAAEIRADAHDRSVALAFADVVDKLDIALMGRVEAQGDDFGGFVDVVYMSISDRVSRPVADFRGEFDMTLMDLAFVWSPTEGRYSGPEVYGGMRYMGPDFELQVQLPQQPPIQTGLDASYTDFLLGGRYVAPINDDWRLVFSGDLSAGDSDGTWSLAGYGIYRNGPHRFYGGYRHLEADFEAGADVEVHTSFSGPVLGYGFAF